MQILPVNGVDSTGAQPLQSLSELGQSRVNPDIRRLIESLGSEDSNVRYQSTIDLIDTQEEGIIAPLLGCLVSGNAYAKRGAAQVLGFIGDMSVVRPLVDSVNDTDELVRLYSLSALGKLVERGFTDPLFEGVFVNYLTSDNPVLVQISSFALSRLRNVDGIRKTIDFLKDEDPDVRAQAAELIREVKCTDTPNLIDPLISCLVTEDDDEVVFNVSLALCSIKDPLVACMLIKHLVKSLDNFLALARIPAILKSIDRNLCTQGLVMSFSEDEVREKYLALVQLGILDPF